MERAFKGIWIPKEIWLTNNLTLLEKVFLVEIDSLDNCEGCYASNDYFANFFNLSKNRCSEVIKSLEKKGLLKINYIYKKNTKSIEKRVIKIIGNIHKGTREIEEGIREIDRRYSENCEDNNTYINNKIYSRVITKLNEKANKSYKHTTKKTKSLIDARLNEGFTEEDFYRVIDNKVSTWIGTDREMYLRPETLFGNKFEGYLNEKSYKKKEVNKTDEDFYPNINFESLGE